MGDSTVHSVSVVVVVSERQGENHFQSQLHSEIGGLGGLHDLVKYRPSLVVDID